MVAHRENAAPASPGRERDWSECTEAERVELVMAELRVIARRLMQRERVGHTLQPTALINEAWTRICRDRRAAAGDRATYMCVAALAMRRVLVGWARRREARLHSEAYSIELARWIRDVGGPDTDLLALDEALERLSAKKPELARLVQLRVFAGLSAEEVAPMFGRSERTMRTWMDTAITFLQAELSKDER